MHEGLQLLHGPFIAHHAGTKCLAVNGCGQGQEKGQSTSIQPLGQIMLMPAPGSVHTGEGRGGSIHAPHAGADALMQEGASAGSSLAYQGGGKRVPQCRIAGHCHTSPPSTREVGKVFATDSTVAPPWTATTSSHLRLPGRQGRRSRQAPLPPRPLHTGRAPPGKGREGGGILGHMLIIGEAHGAVRLFPTVFVWRGVVHCLIIVGHAQAPGIRLPGCIAPRPTLPLPHPTRQGGHLACLQLPS